MMRRPISFIRSAMRGPVAGAWILAAALLLSGYARAAQEIPALPPDPARQAVEIQLLTMDARTERPVVWMDRGASQGIHRGDMFHVFHNGAPAGTLTVDTVLHSTSSGTLSPVADYTGPLYGAAFEIRKIEPPGESLLAADFVFSPRVDSALSLNGIQAPRRGALSQPWRKEYDTDLNTLFRSIAGSGPVSIKAPPPPPAAGALPLESASVPAAPAPVPQDGFRLRELDPDMAREIKSGFLPAPGDCIHFTPWPDRTDGFFVEIPEDQTLTLPGPRFVSTNGKSLLRLEKEIGALPAFQDSPVRITPCVRTAAPAPGALPR